MIIFIYGTDSWRAHHKVLELKKKFKQKVDPSGSGIIVVNGEDFDIGSFRQDLLSQSLFSKGRMILVRDLLVRNPKKKLQEEIIEILKKSDNHTILWWENITSADIFKKIKTSLLFKYLKQQKFVQEYNALKSIQLEKWVQNRVVEIDGKIGAAASKTLLAQVGDNLWQLDNEIQKLVLYCDGREITTSDVLDMVVTKIGGDGWEFLYYLSQKNKPKALEILEEQLILGSEAIEIFGRIVWQFRILLLVKDTLEEKTFTSNEIATKLQLHPYVVQKSLPVIKNFSLNRLKEIYQQLAELDYKIKTGASDPVVMLNLFIINL